MGGMFGGSGAGGLPPTLPGATPGGGGAPALQNALAQMLAQQGPQYQVPDTRWGMAGDRLLRFTPQQGNAGMAAGGLGKGGPPPTPGGGGSGVQSGPNGSTVIPGLNPLEIGGPGGGTQINWANLITAMQKPTTDPTGAPAINTAMEKLKQGTPASAANAPAQSTLQQLAGMAHKIANNPPGRGASQAEKDAWFAQKTAAEAAYNEAQKRTGLGPGGYTLT